METNPNRRMVGAFVDIQIAERVTEVSRALDLTQSQWIRRLILRELARLERAERRASA